MHFKDGTTAKADIVLAADGIKSSIRDVMVSGRETASSEVADAAPPAISYSGTAGYRGLVRQDHALALGVDTSMWRGPMVVSGKNKV